MAARAYDVWQMILGKPEIVSRLYKYSVVIDLNGDGYDELTARILERRIASALRVMLEQTGLSIAHLEAAPGSLQDAFGVGLEAK